MEKKNFYFICICSTFLLILLNGFIVNPSYEYFISCLAGLLVLVFIIFILKGNIRRLEKNINRIWIYTFAATEIILFSGWTTNSEGEILDFFILKIRPSMSLLVVSVFFFTRLVVLYEKKKTLFFSLLPSIIYAMVSFTIVKMEDEFDFAFYMFVLVMVTVFSMSSTKIEKIMNLILSSIFLYLNFDETQGYVVRIYQDGIRLIEYKEAFHSLMTFKREEILHVLLLIVLAMLIITGFWKCKNQFIKTYSRVTAIHILCAAIFPIVLKRTLFFSGFMPFYSLLNGCITLYFIEIGIIIYFLYKENSIR